MDTDTRLPQRRRTQCKHGLIGSHCAECKRPSRRGRMHVGDNVEISAKEAAEFFAAVAVALKAATFDARSHIMLVGRLQWGVAISFDGRWEPFLGHTLGYNNETKPPRLPIRERSRVLEVTKVWLMRLGRPIRGGRVFINMNGVLCEGSFIGRWQWYGPDPVVTI